VAERRLYGVTCNLRGSGGAREHVFSVRTTLGSIAEANRPIEVIDSAQLSPTLDPDGFGDRARRLHGAHRDDGRAVKGRLFYITASRRPIGFIAFHVAPAGPLVIETLVVDARLSPAVADMVRSELLMVVAEASDTAGRELRRVAWATGSRATRDAVIVDLGFAPAPKPRDGSQRPRFYLERSLP